MTSRRLRVATTKQLESAARAAGFDTYVLPPLDSEEINRSIEQRLADGAVHLPFLKQHAIELVIDFDTSALTLTPEGDGSGQVCITPARLGIPYVSCLIDPVTSVMGDVPWAQRWQVFESENWVKWVCESAHAEELIRLGVPNVLSLPMAAPDADYDTSPVPEPDSGSALAFMGHPASSWFQSDQTFPANQMFPALTAAAVHTDMPDVPFHTVFYDMYEFGQPASPGDSAQVRATKATEFYNAKYLYSAYLSVKRRDRFARFLHLKLADNFELIGDHWDDVYGLPHTPRIWDRQQLFDRMRRVPICLNLLKGCSETGMNQRHFEITANGGFMLTHYSPELASCFEVGVECDVFHNEEDLLQKVAFYLDNPERRREIAQAGQRRTLSEHLYSHRLTSVVEALRQGGILPTPGPVEFTPRMVTEGADALVAATTDVMPFGLTTQ